MGKPGLELLSQATQGNLLDTCPKSIQDTGKYYEHTIILDLNKVMTQWEQKTS